MEEDNRGLKGSRILDYIYNISHVSIALFLSIVRPSITTLLRSFQSRFLINTHLWVEQSQEAQTPCNIKQYEAVKDEGDEWAVGHRTEGEELVITIYTRTELPCLKQNPG